MDPSSLLQLIQSKKDLLEEEAPGTTSTKLSPQLVDLYRNVGKVLAKYRSGPVPKAFKIVPTLSNWEDILALTEPDNWSAASIYEATKIFVSNLKSDMAQRFFNMVLLPRLRDDIQEYKKLNFHLYNSLKRALYKPAAFFKGIIIPLCEDEDTTLREAVIIGSILKKVSIPSLHSAAALLKMSEMPYLPHRGVFIMELLSKNYALPYHVLDGIVDYFMRCEGDVNFEPNLLWHQLLLKFCQSYASDISSEQRDALIGVNKKYCHDKMGPEIRNVLQKTIGRDVEEMPVE